MPGAISADPWIALVGIVVLALAIRLAAIGSPLHIDDAYSWLVSSQPSPHAFLRQLAASENTPPLFYLLLTPLPIGHPVWLRMPSVLAGTAMCAVVYLAARRRLGERPALLAALMVAVAPFLITDSDLARGFMVEDLALLVALWALVRLADGESRQWVGVFLLASVIALYTEYSAAIFLVALALSALMLRRPRRRTVLITTGLALATMIPWIPQVVRGQNQVGLTKIAPPFAGFSPVGLRDAVLVLVFGEHLTTDLTGRWLVFVAIVAVIAVGAWLVHRACARRTAAGRYAIGLIAATSLLTVVGHAIAPGLGIDVFSHRYMTILIPLGAMLAAAAIDELPGDAPYRVAAAALIVLGVVSFVRRVGADFEPSPAPLQAAAIAARPRSVLTNTPIVLYYLRELRPQFDRPSNMGRGLTQSCARPCVVIDDLRTHGGTPRAVTGERRRIGPYLVTVVR